MAWHWGQRSRTTKSTTVSTTASTTTSKTTTSPSSTTTTTTTASATASTSTTASTTTESTTATTATTRTATVSTSTTAYRTILSTTTCTSKGTSEIGHETTTQITNVTSYPRSNMSTTAINKGTESASRQSAIIAGPTVGVVVIVTVVLILFCILYRRKKSSRAEKSNGLNTHNIAYETGSHTELSTLPKPVDGGSDPPIYMEFHDEEHVYNEASDDAQCPQSSPDETDNYNRILFNEKQLEVDPNYERLGCSTMPREQPEYSHIAPTSVCRANVGVNYHRVGPHKPGSNTTQTTCFEEQYGVYNHLNDHGPNKPMSRSQKEEEETDNQYSHLGQTNYKQGLDSKQVPKVIMESTTEVENNKQSTVRNGIPAYDAVSNMTVCNVKDGSNLPGPTTLDYELPVTFLNEKSLSSDNCYELAKPIVNSDPKPK